MGITCPPCFAASKIGISLRDSTLHRIQLTCVNRSLTGLPRSHCLLQTPASPQVNNVNNWPRDVSFLSRVTPPLQVIVFDHF